MTREEKIKQALSKYIKDRGVSGDYIVDVERDAAFIAGALWADRNPPQNVINLKNVWHDAEEEPIKDTYILIETSFFEDNLEYYSHYWSASSAPSWEEYVKEYYVKMWAYIADLLPKGGEK